MIGPAPGVLWLDGPEEPDRARLGGKGFALALLRRHGLPVPPGFVLAAGSRLEDEACRRALAEGYRRLGGSVAVRSSSVLEDGAEASFAGQFTTVLEVEGEQAVIEAARACLRSAAAATAYAGAVGAGAGAPMAVLVQRFVPARAAGVVFTRDPRDPESLVVEAHPGRGDALVAGRVRPERYRLDRRTGARREAPPTGATLDDADLEAVTALAREAERLMGAPQDVEWALGEDGPVLLQSRPITAEAEEPLDPRIRRLTRANVGEVLPGPVTPLTWTTVVAFLEQAFQQVAALAGVRPSGAPAFLVLHRRRVYLNLTLSLEVATRLPGVQAGEAERLILGGGAARPAGNRPAKPAAGPWPALRGRTVARLFRLSSRLEAAVRRAEQVVGALPTRDAVAPLDGVALAARLEALAVTGREVGMAHVAVSGASAVRLALLGRALGWLFPGDATERVSRLVSGLEDVDSASPALALEALAAEAGAQPEWRAWLSRPAEEVARALSQAPLGLGERLRRLLAAYGHRGLSEAELSARSWADDPAPVLSALQTLVAAGDSPALRRRARAELRRADEEALFSRLGPLLSAALRLLLRQGRQGVRRREHTKSLAIALVDHTRALSRAGGRWLLAQGLLHSEEEVYFLTREELLRALRGGGVPAAALRRRRRAHEREAALPAPREVDLDHEGPGSAHEMAGGALEGLGVSAGVGVGAARVIAAGEAPRLEPGEVLVTPVLDAALGPLLASAAGAVAEMGGLLSHGAVVARELAVPCVVDVREATRRIRPGQRVLVDGGRGRVVPWTAGGVPEEGPLAPVVADPTDEAFHAAGDDALFRESVYVNVQDPARGVALVATAGVRAGGRGEALAALALPDGRVLFRLDRERAQVGPRGITVGALRVDWDPPGLRLEGALAPHEEGAFPPGPLPLLLAPRTARVRLRLVFSPSTPAVDFVPGLAPEQREAVRDLGSHHVEQSGTWRGELEVDGRALPVEGTGSRDHSWGRRDWGAVDHSRLFTLRLGDDLAVHGLVLSARGRLLQGGFLWRDGRLHALTRVEYATEREGGSVRAFDLEVSSGTQRLRLRGTVLRTVTVPVQVERRPTRHLRGRPYRLLLHECFTRYEGEGRQGYGLAEFSERP